MKHSSSLVLGAVVAVLMQHSAVAHPADGFAPNLLPNGYGTLEYRVGPEEQVGAMSFSCPYPDPEYLTEIEKYMIAGAPQGPHGYRLDPWVRQVGVDLAMFYNNEGYIPDVFSEDILLKLSNGIEYEQWYVDLYKSPITGEFPRLDSATFSPGNLFVHVVSESEKRILAQDRPDLYSAWFENTQLMPGTEHDCQEIIPSPVIYLRMYGFNDVILETFVDIRFAAP